MAISPFSKERTVNLPRCQQSRMERKNLDSVEKLASESTAIKSTTLYRPYMDIATTYMTRQIKTPGILKSCDSRRMSISSDGPWLEGSQCKNCIQSASMRNTRCIRPPYLCGNYTPKDPEGPAIIMPFIDVGLVQQARHRSVLSFSVYQRHVHIENSKQ
jgi:hypothetical protein